MSQVLTRIAKKKKHGLFRSMSTVGTPYLLFDHTNKREMTPSCEPLVDLNLYDPRKDEIVKIPDQTLTKDLLSSYTVGSSRGWVVAKNSEYKTLHLTNMYNPSASASSRKAISLPPTEEVISRISLSASPDQEDCVVAAKSVCSSLIMCRPGDSDWTPVKVPFFALGVIYSDKDGKFYLNKRMESEYDGPVDLVDTTSSGFPQVSLYQGFLLSNIPKSRVEHLSSNTTSRQHFVESPSGQSFIVYWFDENKEEFKASGPMESSIRIEPRGFVVFRKDPEQKITSYTQDIGDLCIFLGTNEAFCVSATEYPGLKPNSIYFASRFTGFGIYDLSSNTVHDVTNPPPFHSCYKWLAPLQ